MQNSELQVFYIDIHIFVDMALSLRNSCNQDEYYCAFTLHCRLTDNLGGNLPVTAIGRYSVLPSNPLMK